jgi:hypothetical protein
MKVSFFGNDFQVKSQKLVSRMKLKITIFFRLNIKSTNYLNIKLKFN